MQFRWFNFKFSNFEILSVLNNKSRKPLAVETLLWWAIMGGSYNVNKKGVTKQELSSDQEKNCNSFSKRSIKTLPNDLKQF